MTEHHQDQRRRFARRRREALSDRDLVAAIGLGDTTALAEVFGRESARIFTVARMICGPDQAQDVVQDVMTSLWQRPDRYDASRGSLRGFLRLQALSRAVDLLRSDGSRSTRERAGHRKVLM